MTRVTVFMKQVISGNYSYLRQPSLNTNYTRLGHFCECVYLRGGRKKSKVESKQLSHENAKTKYDETMIFFICQLFLFDFKSRKLTPDLRLERISRLPVRWSASSSISLPLKHVHCDRIYFWKNFDEICYMTKKGL